MILSRVTTRAFLLAWAAVTAIGCHRAQAARLPEPPVALEVPRPPTRDLTPVVLAEYEPPPPPVEEEPPPVTPTPPRPAANRPPDKPAATPSSSPAPDTPAPVLQTTTNPNASEQTAIRLLQAAESDLARVSYNQLAQGDKDKYMQIRSDVQQAKDALSIKNYGFALRLAERSATLAAGLVAKR
jgi:hypothetical protein